MRPIREKYAMRQEDHSISLRRKKSIDKRNRALFELNMGSKRSAVTLISYIYKNVKRKRKVEFGRN